MAKFQKAIWVLLLTFSFVVVAQAQLLPGDLVILGINPNDNLNPDNCNGPSGVQDVIILAALVDIPSETEFIITDNGYDPTLCNGKWGDTEGVLKFTTPDFAVIPAGTVIRFAINTGPQTYVQLNHPTAYPLTCTFSGAGDFNITAAEGSEDQLHIITGSDWTDPAGANNATTTGTVIFGINNDDTWDGCSATAEFDSELFGNSLCYKVTHFETFSSGQGRYFIYNGPLTSTNRWGWISRVFTPICNWQGYNNCTDWNAQGIANSDAIVITPLTDALSCIANCNSCPSVNPTLQIALPVTQSCGPFGTFNVNFTININGTNYNSTTTPYNINPGLINSTTTYNINSLTGNFTIGPLPTYSCPFPLYPGTETVVTSGLVNPAANAGADLTPCTIGVPVPIAGSLTGVGLLPTWTIETGGTGTFGNANVANTTFTPDAAGLYVLKLSTNDPDGAGPCVAASDFMTMNISPITAPTPVHARRCGNGNVVLSATGCGSNNTVWYNTSSGGAPLATTTNYTATGLTTTTIFYAACETATCASARVPVMAIVHPQPPNPILTATDTVLCGNETVTFVANMPIGETGTYRYQFFKNGTALGPVGASNSISLNTWVNGDAISCKAYKTITYNGISSPNALSGDSKFWPSISNLFVSNKNPTEPVGCSFGQEHRLHAINITGVGDSIYMLVAGRVSNDNRIILFLDSKSGGYNLANFGRNNAIGGVNTFNSSTTFDTNFSPDYTLAIGTNVGETDYFLNMYTLSGNVSDITTGGPEVWWTSDNFPPASFGVSEATNNATTFEFDKGFELAFKKSDIGYTGGDLKIFGVYSNDNGFLSNQFITPSNVGECQYGNGAVNFGLAAPNPITVPQVLLEDDCIGISNTITMDVGAIPTVSITPAAPLVCASGGNATLTAVSSVPSYLWTGGSTASTLVVTGTGFYYVTVTGAFGCTNSAVKYVGAFNAPTLTATATGETCFLSNGYIDLNVSGGAPPYTYDWSNDGPETPDNDPQDINNLNPGVYTVTVTDLNCATTSAVTVNIVPNTPPIISCISPVVVNIGAGGTGTLLPVQLINLYSDNCSASASTSSVSQSTFTCANIGSGTAGGGGLFISEYIEGANSQKFIEIFNGTGAAVTLTGQYSLKLFSNGSSTATTTAVLSGTIVNNGTAVFKNSAAVGGTGTVNAAVNFNGNDAIVLWNDITNKPVDIFGNIGENPGTGWSAPPNYNTENMVLRRKSSVFVGISTDPALGFPTLASQWTVITPNTTLTGLGSHTMNPTTGGTTVTLTVGDDVGLTATCSATVYAIDAIAPVLTCPVSDSVYINAAGNVTFTFADLATSFSDNCTSPPITTISGNTFNCNTLSDTLLPTDLFFSEYYEPSTGNNKYLEIYNGTGAAINLSNYELKTTFNNSSSITNPLSGTIANNSTVVLRHPLATIYTGATLSVGINGGSAMGYNGNDAIQLLKISTGAQVDLIGALGEDPGVAWTAIGGYSTSGMTLRRKTTVYQGITTSTSGFPTLATEWDVLPNSPTGVGLGTHAFNAPLSTSSVILTATDASGNAVACTVLVTVIDTTPPAIACPPNLNLTTTVGCTATGVVVGTATAADNCDAVVTTTVSPAILTTYPLGITVLTWTATDELSNTATCTQTITVVDNDAPTVSCQPTFTAAITAGGEYIVDAFDIISGIPTDNCGSSTNTIATTPGILYCEDTGPNTIIVTVTDNAGNTATCQTVLTLTSPGSSVSITPANPVLSCTTPSITLTATGGGTYLWSTGGTASTVVISTAAVYTVTTTASNGCTFTATKNVTQSTTPLAPPVAISDTSCIGQPLGSVTATGCGTGTVLWYDDPTGGALVSTGATFTAPGSVTTTYYAACSLNACESTRTAVNWIVFPLITGVTLTADLGASICEGETVVYTASPTGAIYQYEFFVNGISVQGPSASNTLSYIPNDTDGVTVMVYYYF
jgi:Ig-like domain CHU_C associated/Lamin Tail Domain/HYR domain